MARLEVLPSQAIIDGFKGTIDFYVYHGIPCARKWPRSPGRFRAPAVEAQWPAFATVSKLWVQLSPYVQRAWVHMAAGTPLSGRDLFHKAYIAGLPGLN